MIKKMLAVVTCWIIYPTKSYKKATFKRRRDRAIARADKRQLTTCGCVMVMQDGMNFYVGIASELKSLVKKTREHIGLKHKYRKSVDYRDAIIYRAK